jgi:hypothetical protein
MTPLFGVWGAQESRGSTERKERPRKPGPFLARARRPPVRPLFGSIPRPQITWAARACATTGSNEKPHSMKAQMMSALEHSSELPDSPCPPFQGSHTGSNPAAMAVTLPSPVGHATRAAERAMS